MTPNNQLPNNALIGGFENQEPLYIARSQHNLSLCPGKFMMSLNIAIVPWGFREHRKTNFEVNSKFIKPFYMYNFNRYLCLLFPKIGRKYYGYDC